jgi:hypothetical protein
MPAADEISEEGFGYFRGTWFIGRVPVSEAQERVQEEAEILNWLDAHAATAREFEQLASAIEKQERELIDEPLRTTALSNGVEKFLGSPAGDWAPLGGLEVGVAGLTFALSAVQCLTAASCRWHVKDSWAEYPVVLFAAPAWRIEILADLIVAEGCGLVDSRGMVSVYGKSIRDMHRLAERLLEERSRFRRIPGHRSPRSKRVRAQQQLCLFAERPNSTACGASEETPFV